MIPLRNLNEFNGMVALRFHSYSLPVADFRSSTGTTTGTDEAAVGSSSRACLRYHGHLVDHQPGGRSTARGIRQRSRCCYL